LQTLLGQAFRARGRDRAARNCRARASREKPGGCREELLHYDTSAAFEFRPAPAGQLVSLLGLLLGAHLNDGEVRQIWPLLGRRQRLVGGEVVVEVAHTVGMSHADKDGWSDRNKGLDFAERDFKGFHVTADFGGRFQGELLGTREEAGRDHSEMRGQVGQIGVQFLAELPDKFRYRIIRIGYQGIPGTLHDRKEL
jgi:hypothetical protein